MLKRAGKKLGALAVVCGLVIAVPAAQAQVARRAVVAHGANEIPQFTIQIDAFESLTEAVEFGYELSFDESTLGLAKFRQGLVVRYILALGTFYTYGEADGVLREMCPSAALENCRVRYLGDLDSIDVNAPEEIARPVVAEVSSNVTIMPPLVMESEAPAYVLEEDLSVQIDGDGNYGTDVSGQEYFDGILETEDELLGEASVVSLAVAKPTSSVQPADKIRAYDGEFIYTVQVAAMYRKADAVRVVESVPQRMGSAEILPLIGGRGNLVYSVTVGRFAYKDNAQVFAEDVCDAVGLSGCWVKPLVLVERELKQVSNEVPQVGSSNEMQPDVEMAVPIQTAVPLAQEEPKGDLMVYTVQVAAMYDENDAQNVAGRIPEQNGAVEVIPIRSVHGDVVYSVTVGRFALKSAGQEVADTVCSQLHLSGCWVKPFALIEKARVQEW